MIETEMLDLVKQELSIIRKMTARSKHDIMALTPLDENGQERLYRAHEDLTLIGSIINQVDAHLKYAMQVEIDDYE